VRSSLGYEYYDAHLRRLAPSVDVELAWTGGQAETASVAYRPTLRQAHPVETLPAQDVHRRIS